MRDQSGRHGQDGGPARAPRLPQSGAGATTRRERWAGLRRSLWQPPRPHGEQRPERVVGPLELFYDLAVVVLVAQAARHLAGHLTWRGLGEFAVVFTLVWIAWANGSLHHELHGHDDARARSTFLLQILVLVAMGAFIPEAGGARGAAFAVAAAVLFAVLALLWLLAARGDRPVYRRASLSYVAGTAACAVLLAGAAILPASGRVLAWGLLDAAYLAGFGAIFLAALPAEAATLIVSAVLVERFGLLTIIVLGETLTGVVAGLAREPVSALTLAVGLVAVVVGFGAWWTYFDFAGHRRPQAGPVGQPAVDTQPPSAHRSHRRDGRRDGQPHRPRPRQPHPSRHRMGIVRRRRRRAVRDDAGSREPASLAPRPRPVPATRPHLRCGGRGLPWRRRRTTRTTISRPRARCPAQHPLGTRRRAPPSQQSRLTHRLTRPAHR